MTVIETATGMRLHYVERGRGHDAETVVFSHSYWADHRHFEPQIAALEARYRVIAFDHRDHGQSALATSSYTLEALVQDALAVIEQLGGGKPVHWIGLSTGGFVGMRIALRQRHLLRSLTLMDTSGEPEPWLKLLKYEGMFAVLRTLGVRPLMPQVMREMFAATSLRDPSQASMLRDWRRLMTKMDPHALIRFGKAIFGRDDVLGPLRELELPVLVMVGDQDRATPPEYAHHLAEAIPGARLRTIVRAGHLSTLEQPGSVNHELLAFLGSVT